jgi:hypothetical protein
MTFDRLFAVDVGSRTALAGAVLLPSIAQAQSVWGGTGSTWTTANYNLGTNWSNPPAGAPPVAGGQSAIFDATGGSSVAGRLHLC